MPLGWTLTRRYARWQDAIAIYQRARNLLFSEDLDATVFRFTLNGVNHVAIVGESPLESPEREIIGGALEYPESDSAELTEEIATQLFARRRRFKELDLQYLEIRDQQKGRVRT